MADSMKKHAQAVVIGGGVTGCSILYHLAKMGWTDSVLLERRELTSGSSWHAAGSLFVLTAPNNVAALQKYTFELYPKLAEESGQDCGFFAPGGLSLALSGDQYLAMKMARSRGKRLDIDAEFISCEEAREMAPLLNTDGLHAVMYETMKGQVDPASVTQAYARAARKMGAGVYRHTEVIETNPLPRGGWSVVTNQGTIECDVLVNAAGLWGREVAAMAGIYLPLMPVEHHYLVTESVPTIAGMSRRFPNISIPELGLYIRQEGQGLLFGAYEKTCHHWSVDGTPLDFDHELLEDDLSRMEWNFEQGCRVLPCMEETGIKNVINGPMIFSPDLGPLLGPFPGLPDYFCACGVMTGFNQGGGIGRELAHWIIDGEPSLDIFGWDVTRFGDQVGVAYTRERTRYFYEHRTERIYPEQQFPAGRPVRTFPTYDKQKEAGAVFGESFGWEAPLWYAREQDEPRDIYGFKRGNWFDAVGEECRAVRDSAGLFEVSTFAKYLVMGEDAEDWLNYLLANRVPAENGRTRLSPMLSHKGRVIGDFTVTRLDDGGYMMLGAGGMQRYHMRHFETELGDSDFVTRDVEMENLSLNWAGLMLAGPNARSILSRVAGVDVSGNAFPFLSAQAMSIGNVPDAIAFRVSFTGELGYEIYCPMEYHRTLFETLMEAGADEGLRLAGGRALMSLRLEKSFPTWGTDLSPDYTPFECGMERWLKLDKDAFIGREAALAAKEAGPSVQRVTMVVNVEGVDYDPVGGEAIFADGERIGYVSSGGYGHTVGESLALACINPDAFHEGAACTVEILGDERPAIMTMIPRVDPDGSRMRG